MDDIDVAERELSVALAILRDGRQGASVNWLRAAEHYVAHCRQRLERLARGQREQLDVESRIDRDQPLFFRTGHRPN